MAAARGVAITNPLVLYRSWISLGRLQPDPAQHRLAIHLQTLYDRLKDYAPAEEYSHKLEQLNQLLNRDGAGRTSAAVAAPTTTTTPARRGPRLWQSLLAQSERRNTLALTRSLTDHEAAMQMSSPQGLLIHGQVGNGKSTLVDMFAGCLPTPLKRRYHYSTFMLEVLSRLELLRKRRIHADGLVDAHSHSLLWLARDLISSSPILFLDEFQLPDRMAVKVLSTLLTAFFRLGGVLIATSNRLPDELTKATGMGYSSSSTSLGLARNLHRPSSNGVVFAGMGEFGDFLHLLQKRCDFWQMEGSHDYRRDHGLVGSHAVATSLAQHGNNSNGSHDTSQAYENLPARYLLSLSANLSKARPNVHHEQTVVSVAEALSPGVSRTAFLPCTSTVYGRTIKIPRAVGKTSVWTFDEICATELGPADYITLASKFHTFIITHVPVLTTALKNEARRFITLLDALYEARCKLAVSAAASPDHLFFPDLEIHVKSGSKVNGQETVSQDSIHAETFAEIHQDLTSPFRPNISTYNTVLAEDALEDDPPNRTRGQAFILQGLTGQERTEALDRHAPNFSLTTSFVGEDEKFAYKRATSRLWQMCGAKWWARTEQTWWTPLPQHVRHWEGQAGVVAKPDRLLPLETSQQSSSTQEMMGTCRNVSESEDDVLFRHGASPFRTSTDPPPRIQPEHVWGMQTWGKRAGPWGQGVKGLQDRKKSEE